MSDETNAARRFWNYCDDRAKNRPNLGYDANNRGALVTEFAAYAPEQRASYLDAIDETLDHEHAQGATRDVANLLSLRRSLAAGHAALLKLGR
jgi:hypothetical protein